MFSTFKQRLLLGMFIFIILSIPVGAYLVSQSQIYSSKASEPKLTKLTKSIPTPSASPVSSAKQLLSISESNLSSSPTPTPSSSSPSIATSFGPTLSLKAVLEGRPVANQATKLFVGIVEGTLLANPKFLLSFTLDLPSDGSFGNLSLAGLSPGRGYSALLKGAAQIATSSAFIMSPTVTNLNDGQPIHMPSGDLNEDNVINSADYNLAQKALGATPTSANWNKLADLNTDGKVNVFDLAQISKNLGKEGASGAWTSPLPKVSTPAASLTQSAIGSALIESGSPDNTGGYWLWIPK